MALCRYDSQSQSAEQQNYSKETGDRLNSICKISSAPFCTTKVSGLISLSAHICHVTELPADLSHFRTSVSQAKSFTPSTLQLLGERLLHRESRFNLFTTNYKSCGSFIIRNPKRSPVASSSRWVPDGTQNRMLQASDKWMPFGTTFKFHMVDNHSLKPRRKLRILVPFVAQLLCTVFMVDEMDNSTMQGFLYFIST